MSADQDNLFEEPEFEDRDSDDSDDDENEAAEGDEDADEEQGEENDDEDGEEEELTEEERNKLEKEKELWIACSNGDLARAKQLVQEGVDPNAPNYDAPAVSGDEMIAVFPLFIAAQNGHIDVVRWLISGESPLTRANKMNMHNESTALHFAGMNDHVEIMKLLLDDPNAPDINAGTEGKALHFTALRGRLAATKFLIENGADIEALDECDQTPIFGAAFQGKTEICRYLYECGANVNAVEQSGDTALCHAAVAGTLGTIKFFVEETNVNLDYRKPDGRSVFDCANENQMSEAALYLWRRGVGTPLRRLSTKVLTHRRLYVVNRTWSPEFISASNVGPKLILLDPIAKTLYSCDLDKIAQVNLQSLWDISLPDASTAAKRALNPQRCGKLLELRSPLQVRYLGTEQDWASSVQSNWSIGPQDKFGYFEIHIDSSGLSCEVAIGLAWDKLDVDEELPGWSSISFALHGDNGDFYINENPGVSFSLRFQEGDTVGMGICRQTKEIFLTMNGQMLGVAATLEPAEENYTLYPSIGLRTPGSQVTVNFGQQPFKFDFVVDSISFEERRIEKCPLRLEPFVLVDDKELVNVNSSWQVVRINLDSLECTQTEAASSDGKSLPTFLSHKWSYCAVGRKLWIFHTPIYSDIPLKLFPELQIFSLDVDTSIVTAHSIDTTALNRKVPKTIYHAFNLHAIGKKIYFFFKPKKASFYIDTETMSVQELFYECPPAGYFQLHDVNGQIFSSSTEIEYPWSSTLISAFEENEWTTPRFVGPPVRSRSRAKYLTHKDSIIFFAGLNGEYPCPDFDIVTVSDGSTASTKHFGFLLTPSGDSYADIVLKFPNGESAKLHRAVLSSRSSKLRTLIESGAFQSGVIEIPVKYYFFKHVIDYIYTDSVSLSIDQADSKQLAEIFDEWLPEHSLRACEYMTLTRVMAPSTMGSDIAQLLKTNNYADITLSVNGHMIQAHRSILVSRSEYFRAMLLGKLRESSQTVIEIEDMDYQPFKIILEYIYAQTADPSDFADSILDVITAASRFGVDGLVRLLEGVIAHNLDADNVDSILELAESHGFHWLHQACQRFLDK